MTYITLFPHESVRKRLNSAATLYARPRFSVVLPHPPGPAGSPRILNAYLAGEI